MIAHALNVLRGLLVALLALGPLPALAAQQSIVMPTTGPMSMGTFVGTYLNPGLLAMSQCQAGNSAPITVGPGSNPITNGCWWDTSGGATAWVLRTYDGANWVAQGTLNTSTHVWVPSLSGASITGTLAAGSTPFGTSSTNATWSPNANKSALTNGAVCDGTTDDSAAFTAMSAAGGGYFIPTGRQCAVASTVTFSSNSTFLLSEGASFTWSGSNGGTMFQSSSVTTLTNFSLIGADPGGPSIFCIQCGKTFDLHSMQYNTFRNLNVYSNSATNTIWSVFSNSSSGSGTSAANSFQNFFYDIVQSGPAAGTVWSVGGNWNGSSVVNTFTGNNFHNISGGYYPGGSGSIMVCGFCIVSATDSNQISGEFYFEIGANNAVGVHFNASATPNSNVGVYNWNIQKLDVDCFSTFTGRVSLKLDYVQHVIVGSFYSWNGSISPSCEGGSTGGMVLNANASYSINYFDGPSSKIFNYSHLSYISDLLVSDAIGIYGTASGLFLIGATSTGSPYYGGTITNDNAPAGNIGEFMSVGCPATSASVTFNLSGGSPANTVIWTAHGYTGLGTCPVVFSAGTPPTGISNGTVYWTVPSTLATNTFSIATSVANAFAGTVVTLGGSPSGETITAGTPLATTVAANISALPLTAGDWDCTANLARNLAGSTSITKLLSGMSTTSATEPPPPVANATTTVLDQFATAPNVPGADTSRTIPIARFSLASTTPTYLVGQDTFTAGASLGYGFMSCRRAR